MKFKFSLRYRLDGLIFFQVEPGEEKEENQVEKILNLNLCMSFGHNWRLNRLAEGFFMKL